MPLTCLIVDLEGQEGGMQRASNCQVIMHATIIPLNSPIRPVNSWIIIIGAWSLQTFPLFLFFSLSVFLFQVR